MTTPLQELLHYKAKEPKYVLTAFRYADEYADGLFTRGFIYGLAVGVISTLIALIIIIRQPQRKV